MAARRSKLDILINADAEKAAKELKKICEQSKRFGEALSMVGRQGAIAGGALTAGLGLAVREYARFEENLKFVGTMLGEQSARVLPEYTEQISDMAIKYGEASGALLLGTYDILSATVPANEAMIMLDAAVVLAAGHMADVTITARGLVGAINAFGKSFTDAHDVADMFAATIERGSLTMNDLVANLGKVGAEAHAAGIDLEEVLMAIAAITRNNIRADVATTALAGAINAFSNVTKEGAAIAKKYNLELSISALQRDKLIPSIMKLSKLTSDELFALIGERRARRAITGLLGQQTKLQEDYAAMTNRAGLAMSKQADTADSLARRFRSLREIIQAVQRELAEPLTPGIAAFTDSLREALQVFREIPDPIKAWAAESLAVDAALLTIGGTLSIVVGHIIILIARLKEMQSLKLLAFMKGVGTALLAVPVAIGGFKFGKWISDTTGFADAVGSLTDRLFGVTKAADKAGESLDEFTKERVVPEYLSYQRELRWWRERLEASIEQQKMLNELIREELGETIKLHQYEEKLRLTEKEWGKIAAGGEPAEEVVLRRIEIEKAYAKEIENTIQKIREEHQARKQARGAEKEESQEIIELHQARLALYEEQAKEVEKVEEALKKLTDAFDAEQFNLQIREIRFDELQEALEAVGETLDSISKEKLPEVLAGIKMLPKEFEALTKEFKKETDQWKEYWKSVTDAFYQNVQYGMTGAFSNFFAEVGTGMESLGDAWNNFCINLRNAFIRAFADMLANEAVRTILGGKFQSPTGVAPGGGGGGIGSWIGSAISAIGSVFTGGATLATPISGAAVGEMVVGGAGALVPAFQRGGLTSGGLAITHPGEYVINPVSTSRNLSLLEDINQNVSGRPGMPVVNIINVLDPDLIPEGLLRNRSTVVNIISEEIAASGELRSVLGEFL